MNITKIRGASPEALSPEIDQGLRERGMRCVVSSPTSTSISLQDCRLTDEYVKEHGYNISPYSGRRGKILNWDNWVTVNNTINDVLDRHKISANASSLHGLFRIREGTKRFGESDWEHLAWQNIGSVMRPFPRREAWRPERE